MNKVLVTLAALLMTSISFGQLTAPATQTSPAAGPGFGTGIMTMLLMDTDVSKELKITDDQRDKLIAIGDGIQVDMQKAMQDAHSDSVKMQASATAIMEKAAKAQMDVLTPDQRKRLTEIFVQDNGVVAVINQDIQKDLGFKDLQTKKVSALKEGMAKAMRVLGEKAQKQEIEYQQFQSLIQKNQKILHDELDKILTDAQRSKLKEMEGKPFARTPR